MKASNERLFLTQSQAIKAICADFTQYKPQLMLFSEILRLISKGNLHLKREAGRNGAWVNTGATYKMQWLEGPKLAAYMCAALVETPMSLDKVVSICARVFQTHAEAGVSPNNRTKGIFIETGMADYVCRQCGHCCQRLDYHNEVTAQDVQQWQANSRSDILERVGHANIGGKTQYRIWVRRNTGQLETVCPFLKKNPAQNQWFCRIHEHKPTICRDYPVSRKHAHMTGCPGFES